MNVSGEERAQFEPNMVPPNDSRVSDKVPVDTKNEWTPKKQAAPLSEINGESVQEAALYINRITAFSDFLFRSNSNLRVTGGGWFEQKAGDPEFVKFTRQAEEGGESSIQLQMNAKYAHASPEMLRALAGYEFTRWLQDSGRLKMDPVDAKLASLFAAAISLKTDTTTADRHGEIWSGLLQKFGLPDIPLDTVLQILDSEHFTYAGNKRMLNELKATLSPEVLGVLAHSDVGAPVKK